MVFHCDSAAKQVQRPISKEKKRQYSASSFTVAVDLGLPDNIEGIGRVS